MVYKYSIAASWTSWSSKENGPQEKKIINAREEVSKVDRKAECQLRYAHVKHLQQWVARFETQGYLGRVSMIEAYNK
jgi:hypothetical protein